MAVIAVVGSFFVPEVRQHLGLERATSSVISSATKAPPIRTENTSVAGNNNIAGNTVLGNSNVVGSHNRVISGNRLSTGKITQSGTNNIAQVGNNNQATITAVPTVNSIVLEGSTVCDVTEGQAIPLERSPFLLLSGDAVYLGGSGQQIDLVPVSPTLHPRQGENRVGTIQRFALPQDSEWLGKPVSELSFVDKVSFSFVGLGGWQWCAALHGMDLSVAVNGKRV